MPLLHHQPFKGLWLVCFALKLLLIDLPFFALISIPKSNRPSPTWTHRRAVIVHLMRSLTTNFTTRLKLRPGRDLSIEVKDSELQKGAEFNWIEPVPTNLIRGEIKRLADINDVEPIRIPGYWIFRKGWVPTGRMMKAQKGEKVVIHFHGGSYHLGSAHPSEMTTNVMRGLLKQPCPSGSFNRTFAVDYRLSLSSPFPASGQIPSAILDGLAGYLHVLSLGFTPSNIFIAGDSAGGNLALAMVRYIVQERFENVPTPGGIILYSAWADLNCTRRGPDSSEVRNTKYDIFSFKAGERRGGYGAVSLLSRLPMEEAETNPYISPASVRLENDGQGIFKGFPPTFISVGGKERLQDDSTVVEERMKRDGVENVVLDVEEDAVHDPCVFAWHEPERSRISAKVVEWMEEL